MAWHITDLRPSIFSYFLASIWRKWQRIFNFKMKAFVDPDVVESVFFHCENYSSDIFSPNSTVSQRDHNENIVDRQVLMLHPCHPTLCRCVTVFEKIIPEHLLILSQYWVGQCIILLLYTVIVQTFAAINFCKFIKMAKFLTSVSFRRRVNKTNLAWRKFRR